MINAVQTVVLLLNPEGEVIYFNRHLEKLSGWSLDQTRGKNWFELFLPLRHHTASKEWFQLALGDAHPPESVSLIVTKDGRDLEIEWHHALFKDEEGRLVGPLCSGRDITEREKTQKALRERTFQLRTTVEALEAQIFEGKQLEQEILAISECEQRRLGQDLHDGLGQELAGIALLGQVLANKLQAESHPSAKNASDISPYTSEALDSARGLASGLYPIELSRFGVVGGITAH